MGSLFEGLSSATSALRAAQLGLEVTGHNIANINTPGYTRRTVDLAELAPATPFGAGRGVEVVGIRAYRDAVVEARVRREQAGLARDNAMYDGVSSIEATIGLPGGSIDSSLTAFFDSLAHFSTDVTSASARDNVIRRGQQLAQDFVSLSNALSTEVRGADTAVRNAVAEFNQLSATVANLNERIAQGGPEAETLRDARGVALGKMAELADISTIAESDGSVTVTLAGGRAAVVGENAYDIAIVNTPPTGNASLRLQDADITAAIPNGRLGGLIELRDSTLPGYQANLDQMAYDLATRVNAVHVTGFDATGAPGGNFFTPPATVADAARTISMNAALVADPRLLAGSGTGAAGDNQTALALSGLRDTAFLGGGTRTPAGAWADFVYSVGADVSTTRTSILSREQVVQQVQQLRDQASGVSLDEEAANLMRYQRSYEAGARYFTTIVDTIDTLMAMVR